MGSTLESMTQQIRDSLSNAGPYIAGIDVEAIAREIEAEYGLIDINAVGEDGLPVISSEWYWELIYRHDRDTTQRD